MTPEQQKAKEEREAKKKQIVANIDEWTKKNSEAILTKLQKQHQLFQENNLSRQIAFHKLNSLLEELNAFFGIKYPKLTKQLIGYLASVDTPRNLLTDLQEKIEAIDSTLKENEQKINEVIKKGEDAGRTELFESNKLSLECFQLRDERNELKRQLQEAESNRSSDTDNKKLALFKELNKHIRTKLGENPKLSGSEDVKKSLEKYIEPTK